VEQIVRGCSRYHKYTLGTDLRDGVRRALGESEATKVQK
jgi:hypothetical protein